MRYILLLLAAAVTLSGCARKAEQNAAQQQNVANRTTSKIQQFVGGNAQTEEKSKRMEALAKSISQVRNVNCVVIGNTAIVGIDVDPTLERSKVDTIKYSVAEALRKDPDGANAIVTADMDLGERIRRVREDIKIGKPFSGFAQELGDIIGRIVPQLPKDVRPMDNQKDKDAQQQQFENSNL